MEASMRRSTAIAIAVLWLTAACSGGAGTETALDRRPGEDRAPARFATLDPDPAPFVLPAPTPTTPPPAGTPPPADVRLASFDSCDDVLAHVRDQAGRLVTAWGLAYGYGGGVMLAEERTAAPAAGSDDSAGGGSAGGAASGPQHSGTNVQEAGVDEPDLVKTDGRILLAIAQGRLRRVDLAAGGPGHVSDVTLEGGYPTELLLVGDRALVFGSGDGSVDGDGPRPLYGGGQTVMWVLDLSNGGAATVATLRVEGSYLSARLVGGIARVVLSSPLRAPQLVTPEDGTPEAEQRALAHNRQVVATSTLDQWMPRYELRVAGPGGPSSMTGRICPCDRLLRPAEFSGLGALSVLTIDPADPRPDTAASVMADGQNVYASERRLYVATGQWQMAAGDVAVDRVAGGTVTTAVHAFDISDPKQATYLASGAVPGWVINQWALSEHEGVLRVATTIGSGSGDPADPSESMITVVREDGQVLAPVGRIGDLGRGERIYAVRYMGAIGYVVTFRQTDPLYAIDLSDPARPVALGELKIPGFSAYLHPVADGVLMGVGQDADDQGRALGVQASLFDVSDPRAPARVAQWAEGQPSHSPVEHDHRAFLHWAPSGIAVVPVESWGQTPEDQAADPDGARHAVVIRVGTGASPSLDELGRLTHDGRRSDQAYGAVVRSLVVGDVLYTLSDAGLLASDLSTLADRGWMAF
jgi:hypothetical protein